MPELKIEKGLWQDFVAIAEKRKLNPESLAREVLRDFVQQFTDEQLLHRSSAAAARASLRIEESEEAVRQYRPNRRTELTSQ